MGDSIWKDTATLPHFPALKGDIETEVLVVGGGICGVLTAYFLDWAGVDCVLVEADRIGGGVTGNSTAKVTVQHGLIYHKLMKNKGGETARLYLEANQSALERYGQMSQSFDFDFERKTNYVYTMTEKKMLEEEVRAIRSIGGMAEIVEKPNIPIPVAGAVKMRHQAQMNPTKLLAHLIRGLKIYEGTVVRNIRDDMAFTNHGKIKAKKIIIATHFPFLNRYGGYFMKLYQYRSYVMALEDAIPPEGMYVDAAEDGLSFRRHQNLLLLGGGGHRTGKPGQAWEELYRFAAKEYPKAKVRYTWATQDCITLDGIPYIGKYSAFTPHLYISTGMNRWGMTGAMVGALLLRDLILEQKNEYQKIFSPQRHMAGGPLLKNAMEAAKDMLSLSPKRCPHMGCALHWNRAEHSWDCPCHGSRFTTEGRILNNPANTEKKWKKDHL